MSTIKDYSVDEWRAISAARTAIALAITVPSDTDTHSSDDDLSAVDGAMTPPADAPEIIRILVDGIRTEPHRDALLQTTAADREHAAETLIGTVRAAVRAIEDRSPAEAEAFKAWLAWVATKVCHAVHHGRADQAIIEQLTEVLRVTLSPRRDMPSPADGWDGEKRRRGADGRADARRPADLRRLQ